MLRQISQIKDDDALDLLADLLEPVVEICSNEEFKKLIKSKKANRLKIAQLLLKNNKKEIMQILSILSDEEEYHCNTISLLSDVVNLMNDEELISFFTSQMQMEETLSASALESTEGEKE